MSLTLTRKEELLDHVRAYAEQKEIPTRDGYETYARRNKAPAAEELIEAFENWYGVCKAAEVRQPCGMTASGTKKEAVASLKRAYGDFGRVFTKLEYDEWSKSRDNVVSMTSMLRIFEHSWNAGMIEAGLTVTRVRRVVAGPEIEELIRTVCFEHWRSIYKPALVSLRKASRDLGQGFSLEEFMDWAMDDETTAPLDSVRVVFPTWEAAAKSEDWSASDLELESLVQKICGKMPLSVREWNAARGKGVPMARSIALAYGNSWPNALEAAGLKPIHPTKIVQFA